MKKLIAIIFAVGALAIALNFSGVQSVNGLNNPVKIFTAPVSAYYFLSGKLSLPHLSSTGGVFNSRVVASVSKNSATLLYQGAPGASGFELNQISLTSNDYVTVILTSDQVSTLTQDGVINSVTGQVYFGNSF